jgi:RNA chaperone Hfq
MTARNPNRLQDEFLSKVIAGRVPVTMRLLSGAQFHGTITACDEFCIAMICDGGLQAVYKQEISTISAIEARASGSFRKPAPNPGRSPTISPGTSPRTPRPRRFVVERVRRTSPSLRREIRKI